MQSGLIDVSDLNAYEANTAKAVTLLKLLAHPVRLSILCNLMQHDEMSAGDIVKAEEHRASQSQVSQYLAKLRQDKIVSTRRDGQTIYYHIKCPQVQAVIKTLREILCDDDGSDMLEMPTTRHVLRD